MSIVFCYSWLCIQPQTQECIDIKPLLTSTELNTGVKDLAKKFKQEIGRNFHEKGLQEKYCLHGLLWLGYAKVRDVYTYLEI